MPHSPDITNYDRDKYPGLGDGAIADLDSVVLWGGPANYIRRQIQWEHTLPLEKREWSQWYNAAIEFWNELEAK